jgi:hypothetical protein
MKQQGQQVERRCEPRSTELSNQRAEFKLTYVPVYQFKVRDLSAKGAGIVVKADSNFMKMIQVGQEVDVKMIPGTGVAGSSGHQRSRVAHVTELKEGRYRGHLVVGLSFLSKAS